MSVHNIVCHILIVAENKRDQVSFYFLNTIHNISDIFHKHIDVNEKEMKENLVKSVYFYKWVYLYDCLCI